MRRKIWLIIALMLVLTFDSRSAEEKKSEPEILPKPGFSAELRELSFLVGSFTTDISIKESPWSKPGPGKGTIISQWGLDSTFLLFNVDEISSEGRYRGHGYMTYDKLVKKYRLWWFNNLGEGSEYQGDFVRDTLVLEGEIQTPEKIAKLKFLWHSQGENLLWRTLADTGKGYKLLAERMAKRLKIGKINTEVK